MKKAITICCVLILVLLMGCEVPKTIQLKSPEKAKAAFDSEAPQTPQEPQEEIQQEAQQADQLADSQDTQTEAEPSTADAQQDTNVSGDVVEIKEKMFITQCNDVYINPDEYMDKIIVLEGMYDEQTDPVTNEMYSYIYRRGPGCCGNDGVAGFEIRFDGKPPKLNDWIRVSSKLVHIQENGYDYYALQLTELTVLTERGAEFVSN